VAVAAEVVERSAPILAARTIRVDVPRSPLLARGDRDRVAQILGNYLSNAVRHAPDGSVITISATSGGGWATLAVTDRGPGLPDDQLEAVFERFYRVDPARSRSAGGSGIGLTIARALAEAMGGRAWAERPVEGPGVTFVLALPPA
jgi:signal transduction histidine kinase